MKYKIGDKFYRFNNKTKEVDVIEIIDIKYVFDRHVKNVKNFSELDIDDLIEDKRIYTDIEEVKRLEIEQLENKYNIKLKEVD